MHIGRFISAASMLATAAILMTASASASTVMFETDMNSGFNNTNGLSLNSSAGSIAGATISFVADPSATVGLGNVNYGIFTLQCVACGTQASGIGASFNAFTFDLMITDTSDGGTGTFVGTAAAGQVFLDSSTVTLNWVPLVLGPGSTNAMTGTFGTTEFVITPQTNIVNPTSGAVPGTSTLQGSISSSAVPEPMSLSLMGGALLVLGLLRRKKVA
jgi:hypothetical protein